MKIDLLPEGAIMKKAFLSLGLISALFAGSALAAKQQTNNTNPNPNQNKPAVTSTKTSGVKKTSAKRHRRIHRHHSAKVNKNAGSNMKK